MRPEQQKFLEGMSPYIEVCEAAGFDANDYPPEDFYFFARDIASDPDVQSISRSRVKYRGAEIYAARERGEIKPCPFKHVLTPAVLELTVEQKEELRRRIVAKFKKNKQR